MTYSVQELNTKVVYNDSAVTSSKRLHLASLKVVVSVVGLIVIIGGAAGVYVFYKHANASKQKQAAYNSAITTAQKAVNGDNLNGSYVALQTALTQAQTTAQKSFIYGELGAAALSTGRYAQAINYLTLRHQLDSSTVGEDAQTMGECYQQIGDKTDAIKQYKLSIAYYQEPANTQFAQLNGIIPALQAKIQALEQK